ncbi:MAG TPA: redoxin domain-containing protein [Candidatus Saccharimonadales bacterium]|nr:redoxin domain-containing protein [Candidatus Saccharimonadales bacterium]
MNKKLIVILVTIGVLMFGITTLVKSDSNSKEKPTKVQSSLNDMVGKPAPDFSLQNQRGETFRLSEMKGKKTVIFFNEGIMCYPACWNQMAALGTDAQLNNSSVLSASIVVDAPQHWSKAFQQMPDLAKGTVLFDTDKKVSEQYGMLTLESSMHRGSMPGHTYLIIDQQGVVRYTLDDPKMSIRNETLVSELQKI